MLILDFSSTLGQVVEEFQQEQHFIMVFLGQPGSEIEVRLVKPPFDAPESARVYFDEYEKLGTPHPEKIRTECTRYIVPENTTYAIEITLKKGFDYGDYEGIYLQVCNKTTGTILGKQGLNKGSSQTGPLGIGKKIVIDQVCFAQVNGKLTKNANLTFQALSLGAYSSADHFLNMLNLK